MTKLKMSTDFLTLNSCGPKVLSEGLPGLGRGLEKWVREK
jgi:hypothetical protein